NELRNFINHLLEENRYVVQQNSSNTGNTLSEIHSLLMKDENNEWGIVSNHVELRVVGSNNSINNSEQTMKEFIEENNVATNSEEQNETLSINTAGVMDNVFKKQLSEILITYAINENLKLSLIEANPKGP